MVLEDGTSRREHLEARARMGARTPELDDVPPMPAGCQYLLEWFGELAAARGSNGFGLNPLSFCELAAWSQLRGVEPTPWEVGVLRRIDQAYLKAIADARARTRRDPGG